MFNFYKDFNSRKERAKENWNPDRKSRVSLSRKLKDEIIERCENICENCHKSNVQNIHHIDENPNNNTHRNLLGVCYSCHMYLHHGDKEEKKEFIKKLYGEPVTVRLDKEQIEEYIRKIQE